MDCLWDKINVLLDLEAIYEILSGCKYAMKRTPCVTYLSYFHKKVMG